jgi:hypothetical protein
VATPRKHYFRVADSILREGWDDSTLATIVRLMATMNQRWARDGLTAEEASTINLRAVDLLPLTNRTRAAAARVVLTACARAAQMTVTFDASGCMISWPKFSTFQGYDSPKLPRDPPPPHPHPHPPPHTQSRKEKTNTSCSTAGAVAPAPNDPERWVSILGQEPGSAEEKLAFVTRELPLAEAEAEKDHPRDRKAQRGKIRSVLIRHYRWQRDHPAPTTTRQRERPQTFHEITVENTKNAARETLDFAADLVARKEEDRINGSRRSAVAGGAEGRAPNAPLLGARHRG